jgi:hypothetical protein
MLLSFPTGGGSRTIPVMYTWSRGSLVVAAAHPEAKRWWRNLRTPKAVRVRVRGVEADARAVVLANHDEVEQALATYLERLPRSGAALGIERDDHGRVVAESIRDASASTVMVRVTPRQDVLASSDHRSI